MIALKSPREIELMRRSGAITARVLSGLMKTARAGMTTQELDRLAERGIRDGGGIPTFKGYNGFPGSICSSINDQVVHGIPDPRVLRDGDLLSIDIGTTLEGYVSDSAVTIAIGDVSPQARRLLEVTRECLTAGIEQMQVGKHLGDIGRPCRRTRNATASASSAISWDTGSDARCTRSRRCPTTAIRRRGWSFGRDWSWPSSR